MINQIDSKTIDHPFVIVVVAHPDGGADIRPFRQAQFP
jgi:hypothetical protein